MEQKLERIQDLTREIFERSVNVSRFNVKNVGSRIIIKIYDNKNRVVFGMEGIYNNLLCTCKLILKEQVNNR